jgi:hypothetical protein
MVKKIQKISDKLSKVYENYTINMYDNGYMLDVGGNDSNGDCKSAKIMVGTIDELVVLIKEVSEMERT